MIYKYNEHVSAKALSDLREAVGWNRMESEYENPLLTSYLECKNECFLYKAGLFIWRNIY